MRTRHRFRRFLSSSRRNLNSASAKDSGRAAREREQEAGYWLLITSDAATSEVALDARLRALELEDDDGTLLATVRQIPSALVGGRTTNWSAYYVGFAVLSRSK